MKQRVFKSFNDIKLGQIRRKKAEEKAKFEEEPRPATPSQLYNLVKHFAERRNGYGSKL